MDNNLLQEDNLSQHEKLGSLGKLCILVDCETTWLGVLMTARYIQSQTTVQQGS